MTGRRHRAREAAFQALYQSEHGQDSAAGALDGVLAGRRAGPELAAYARSLVEVWTLHAASIDASIGSVLQHWDLDRLAAVDRAILRSAAGELLYRPDVPAEVVIDEAVEIAKKYSTEQSGAFVNGVLDRLWKTIEKDAGAGRPAPAGREPGKE